MGESLIRLLVVQLSALQASCKANTVNVPIERAPLLLRIRQVPGSNVGPGTLCVDTLFTVFSQRNAGIMPENTP